MNKIFKIWLDEVVAPWEGGIADRPLIEDPGGFTNRGVTLKVWQEFAPKLFNITGNTDTLKKITVEQAERIAFEIYWKFYRIDSINNDAIKILVAESCWGGGGYRSLGYSLGSTKERISLINAQSQSNPKLFYELVEDRINYLKGLANFSKNPGWVPRVKTGDKERLSMVQVCEKYNFVDKTVIVD